MVIFFKDVKKYHSSFSKKPTIASSFHASISSRGDNKAILCSASVVLIIIAAIFLCPPIFTNDDPSNAITGTSIASDTTLSISLSGSVLPLNITPTSSSGTFASTANDSIDTNTAVIHVATNNITGYTLGIKASNPSSSTADKLISNNEQCENTPTSAKCAINSLPQVVSEAQYIDNTVEGVDLNNTWGYAPSKYNSTINTTTTTTLDSTTNENITTTSPINYYPAPVSGDTIATTDSPNPENTTASDGTLQSDEYTIDYGMRIDYSPYAGTYSTNYNNQSYIITAVGNPVPYSVSYNSNKPEQAPATSTVDNVPSAQTGTVSGGTTVAVILSSKVPTIGTTDPSTEDYTYAGYVFNGWCSAEPEVPTEINGQPNTNGYQVCPTNADIYHPGDNFGIDQTVDNTQTLYATWGAPATVTFNANGLIFDNTTTTTTTTTNTINYIPTYEGNIITGQRRNRVYTGAYQTPICEETTPTPTNYIIKGWSTDQQSTDPTYTDEQAIIDNLSLNADDNITLYASWAYTTVITFDKNGADGTEIMAPQTIEANTTAPLEQNTYTNTGYVLGSWNTAADGGGTEYIPQGDFQTQAGSNNITLYAQWEEPCNVNSICYRPNGANEGQGAPRMGAQTRNYNDNTDPITSNMAVTLWAMNYKYDTTGDGYNDYGFIGWSKDKDAASKILDADPDNNPTIYGPNQNITLGNVSNNGLNLYAVWLPVAKSSTNTDLAFQTTNLLTTTLADGTTLASKPNGYVTALKDQRDNQVYAVAKLADGNYWMIENLRLDNSVSLDNVNTNNPANGFTTLTASSDSWCTDDNQSSCINQNKLNTNNITQSAAEMTAPTNYVASYGNYYNWYTATAGNGTYEKASGEVAAGDICPAGWNLPLGGVNNTPGSFYYLVQKISEGTSPTDSNNHRTFPNNFIFSGGWHGSLKLSHGHNGFYWSSTAHGTNYAYDLSLVAYYASLWGDSYKYNGSPMRCIINQ